ncbi:MAG: BamA/TamA family outer membrane protein [Spirochaetota bacterium]
MKRFILTIILILQGIIVTSLIAEEMVKDEPVQDIIVLRRDTWLFIPHAYYKPETQVAGGAVFLYTFQDTIMSLPPIKLRPSTMAVTATYTQRDQFIFQVFPEFYLARDKYHIKTDLEYMNYPDRFYGIGPDTRENDWETYTANIFSWRNRAERALWKRIYAGIIYNLDYREMVHTEDGELLDEGDINGDNGGTVSGIGLSLNYDTRDDTIYTRDGTYVQLRVIDYNEYIGSDYDFASVVLDLRLYEPFWFSHVLALHGYMSYIGGEVPFYMLSQMGGQKVMRGLFEGRYRDRNMFVGQAEYRMPVIWRFSAVGFCSVGQVARSFDMFSHKNMVYAYGGGLRFKLKEEQDLNVRLDFGFSRDFFGVYVTIGEAF